LVVLRLGIGITDFSSDDVEYHTGNMQITYTIDGVEVTPSQVNPEFRKYARILFLKAGVVLAGGLVLLAMGVCYVYTLFANVPH
jgi:hypothetical protein